MNRAATILIAAFLCSSSLLILTGRDVAGTNFHEGWILSQENRESGHRRDRGSRTLGASGAILVHWKQLPDPRHQRMATRDRQAQCAVVHSPVGHYTRAYHNYINLNAGAWRIRAVGALRPALRTRNTGIAGHWPLPRAEGGV